MRRHGLKANVLTELQRYVPANAEYVTVGQGLPRHTFPLKEQAIAASQVLYQQFILMALAIVEVPANLMQVIVGIMVVLPLTERVRKALVNYI